MMVSSVVCSTAPPDGGPRKLSCRTDMDFFDVVLNQRACRQVSERPVDSELVERCLEAAVHAPSAENRQPTVFLVLRDPAQRGAVKALTRRAWREGGRAHSAGRL